MEFIADAVVSLWPFSSRWLDGSMHRVQTRLWEELNIWRHWLMVRRGGGWELYKESKYSTIVKDVMVGLPLENFQFLWNAIL